MRQIEIGKGMRPTFAVHLLPRLFLPFPLPPHNVNTQTHELVACRVCDVSHQNTMNDQVHKDMGNIFSKYLDVL